jgi:hypothetical protein
MTDLLAEFSVGFTLMQIRESERITGTWGHAAPGTYRLPLIASLVSLLHYTSKKSIPLILCNSWNRESNYVNNFCKLWGVAATPFFVLGTKSCTGWAHYLRIFCMYSYETGAGGSVVAWGTTLQAGRSRFRFPIRSLDFSIDLILRAAFLPCGRPSL